MRFKNGGDYRFLSQHLSISWGNWGWGLVFYFIGWQRPLVAIFKVFKHPRFQRRKNSLVEIWTFAFFKHLWQDGFHFWIVFRTTKLAPIKTMFQQIKAVFFFYFLFIRFTFRFLTKKVHFRIVPAAAKLIVSRLDKELVWQQFQSLICSKDGSGAFFALGAFRHGGFGGRELCRGALDRGSQPGP